MKKSLLLLLPIVLAYAFTGNSNAATSNPQLVADTPRMKQYWLVTLLLGENRSHDKETADRIQAAHMANIGRLHKQGYIVMAGPMGYNKDLRGIFIMDAKDSATVAQLVMQDSAVLTGRLRFEIHPWWTQTGTYIFK
ncbi:MAG: hypothetical protein EOO14_10420 [Chitinophagaceae bacterium]|nr:MAG: hypothetical protein EOO14_10420 [Chitinophagaceae bacterium]